MRARDLNKTFRHTQFSRERLGEKTKGERERKRGAWAESPMISAKDGEEIWRWHRPTILQAIAKRRDRLRASAAVSIFFPSRWKILPGNVAHYRAQLDLPPFSLLLTLPR